MTHLLMSHHALDNARARVASRPCAFHATTGGHVLTANLRSLRAVCWLVAGARAFDGSTGVAWR